MKSRFEGLEPATCNVWFDGCNQCKVIKEEGLMIDPPLACFTNTYCDKYDKPYCMEMVADDV